MSWNECDIILLIIHWYFYILIAYTSYVTYNCDTTVNAEFRSSRWRCFWKFCKFHKKAPVLQSLFYKIASLQPCNVLTQVFPCEFCEIFKNAYFEEDLWKTASVYWLLHHILVFTIYCSTRFSFLWVKTIELITCEAISFKKYFTERNF